MEKRKATDMSEFEKKFNQEVMIAKSREKRPFISKENATCPFCFSQQESLAPSLLEKWEEGELWAKVIANKYPITGKQQEQGIHDVVIDTIKHLERPYTFTTSHWEGLLTIIQERWHQLMKIDTIAFIQVFKNDGVEAGASISHSHWQIVALKKIPRRIEHHYKQYKVNTSLCYLCHLKQYQEGVTIKEDKYWTIWVPPAPEFPFEVWLIPKKHCQHYGELSLNEIASLGKHMKKILEGYEHIQQGIAYNICFMSGDIKKKWDYHFYIKIVMRIGRIAGFEIATGCHILTQDPKEYAQVLKKNIGGYTSE